jgi:signal transduction histidine kinase
MTVILLVILLFVQIAFFAIYYQNIKRRDMERIGESMIALYGERGAIEEFKDRVKSTAMTTGTNILFFRVRLNKNEQGKPVPDPDSFENILTETGDAAALSDTAIDPDFFARMEAGGWQNTVYAVPSPSGGYVVFGARLDDGTDRPALLHMTTPLTLSHFTSTIMRRQAFYCALICAALSLLLSLFISDRIARPVTEFSKVAKKLGKGDFSVKFLGNGLSEIEDLADTLNYATAEMGKTEALRRELLANVSHDLRTPLTMVKAYAEMIRDISGADPQKRAAHSQVIIDEADRLANLVNDIQNLSKLQSGTETLEKSPLKLSELAKSVLERFNIYSSKDGYIFNAEIEPDCQTVADGPKIEQVLYNLIGNALNYTGADKTVSVFVKKSGGDVVFGVRDTGKGIAPDEIDAVWERYYRSGQSKRKRVGTGLGLSIVKNILEMHGARYGVDSTPGAGSTFWFAMPSRESLQRREREQEQKKKKRSDGGADESDSYNLFTK